MDTLSNTLPKTPHRALSSPRAAYRAFTLQGYVSSEAANLTAVAYDLPVQDHDGREIHWKLKEVQNLLFLASRLRNQE